MTSRAYRSGPHLREGDYTGHVYEELGIVGAVSELCLQPGKIFQAERARYKKQA